MAIPYVGVRVNLNVLVLTNTYTNHLDFFSTCILHLMDKELSFCLYVLNLDMLVIYIDLW